MQKKYCELNPWLFNPDTEASNGDRWTYADVSDTHTLNLIGSKNLRKMIDSCCTHVPQDKSWAESNLQ